MEKPRVFCRDCKYFEQMIWTYRCNHNSNILLIPKYDKMHMEGKEKPMNKNRNNDCSYFKPTITFKIENAFKRFRKGEKM